MRLQCFACGAYDRLHTMPNDPAMAQKWKTIFGEVQPNLFSEGIPEDFRICLRHFHQDFIFHKKHLLKCAVPSKSLLASCKWNNKTDSPSTVKRAIGEVKTAIVTTPIADPLAAASSPLKIASVQSMVGSMPAKLVKIVKPDSRNITPVPKKPAPSSAVVGGPKVVPIQLTPSGQQIATVRPQVLAANVTTSTPRQVMMLETSGGAVTLVPSGPSTSTLPQKIITSPKLIAQPAVKSMPAGTTGVTTGGSAVNTADVKRQTEMLARQTILALKADIEKNTQKAKAIQKKVALLRLKVRTYDKFIRKLVQRQIISKESAKEYRVFQKDVDRNNSKSSGGQTEENAAENEENDDNEGNGDNDGNDDSDSNKMDHDYV